MLGRRIWRFLGHILRQQPETHHITALPWDPRGKEKERLAKNNVTYSVKGEVQGSVAVLEWRRQEWMRKTKVDGERMRRHYAPIWSKELDEGEGGDEMRVNKHLNKTKPRHDALQSHEPPLYIQSISVRSFQWRTEVLVSPLSSNLSNQWNKREIRHVDGTMEQFPPGNLEHSSLDHFRGTISQNMSRLIPHSIEKNFRKIRINKA